MSTPVAIIMPSGIVRHVNPDSLLLLRNAYKEEWDGAVAVEFNDGVLYAIEPLDTIRGHFAAADVKFAELTSPAGPLKLLISAKKVQDVLPANYKINGVHANAIVQFSTKMSASIREKPEVAKQILAAALAT